MRAHYNRIHQQATQAQTGLTALPSDLVRLMLSFLNGRAIPSLLSVSHTARWLCACVYELNLPPCVDNVRFLSAFISLASLDLSWCQLSDVSPLFSLASLTLLNLRGCAQLSDVSPLSSLTSLAYLNLSWCDQLIDVSPLSSLISLTSLDLGRCFQLSNVSPLSSLTSLTSLDLHWCDQLSNVSPLSSLTSLTSLDLRACLQVNNVSALALLPQLIIYYQR